MIDGSAVHATEPRARIVATPRHRNGGHLGDWFSAHYVWLFDGVGGAVLLAVLGFVGRWVHGLMRRGHVPSATYRHQQSSGSQSTNVQAGRDIIGTVLTYQDVRQIATDMFDSSFNRRCETDASVARGKDDARSDAQSSIDISGSATSDLQDALAGGLLVALLLGADIWSFVAMLATKLSADGRLAKIYTRSKAAKAYVLRRAKGFCESCSAPAVLTPTGGSYLEVHHIRPLADDDSDSARWALAICSNCHWMIHRGMQL